MKENQIVDIDGFVHVVNGKVICFTSDVLDISKAEDREELVSLANDLFVLPDLPKVFGDDTICVLIKMKSEPGAYNISMDDITFYSQNVQEKVRLLIDEFECSCRSGC